MTQRLLARLLSSVAVVFGAVTLIFLILNWLPGDPAVLIAGESASEETVRQVRAQLGTDRPLGAQYGGYLWGLLHGDLGSSYVTHEPVSTRLIAQLPSTAALGAGAALVAIVVGVTFGVLSARHHGRALDQGVQIAGLMLVSVPPFWLGILMILLFSVQLGWLPIIGDGGLLPAIMPVTCLGLVVSVPLMRVVRSGVLDGLFEPYVTTLRAKGLSESRVLYVHVLRNSLLAAVTLLSVVVGELISGAVIIETLFARQGLGRLTVEAIGQKDLPMVQGAILLASTSYVLVNLAVDVLYTVIDPRTRLHAEGGA
jgi:ABC-type dipeptide/oligopeptide/nickel transport system permease component